MRCGHAHAPSGARSPAGSSWELDPRQRPSLSSSWGPPQGTGLYPSLRPQLCLQGTKNEDPSLLQETVMETLKRGSLLWLQDLASLLKFTHDSHDRWVSWVVSSTSMKLFLNKRSRIGQKKFKWGQPVGAAGGLGVLTRPTWMRPPLPQPHSHRALLSQARFCSSNKKNLDKQQKRRSRGPCGVLGCTGDVLSVAPAAFCTGRWPAARRLPAPPCALPRVGESTQERRTPRHPVPSAAPWAGKGTHPSGPAPRNKQED